MEHKDSELHLSKEELLFNDLIRRGDDFMKISIYRNAKECYHQALETHFNDTIAHDKFIDCVHKIKKESKIIISIIVIAAIIIGASIIVMNV
jgi:hypothetical protein